jgi:hypothetical protein
MSHVSSAAADRGGGGPVRFGGSGGSGGSPTDVADGVALPDTVDDGGLLELARGGMGGMTWARDPELAAVPLTVEAEADG